MIRIAIAFGLLIGLGAASVDAADDQDQNKPKFGGKFDPEKLKQFQERFKDLDPEKLKQIQEKLKEKGIDIEKFKNLDPEKLKEFREKFKGKAGKGGFDPAKFKDKLKGLDADKIKEIEEKLKEKGVDAETIKLIKERLGGNR